MNNILTHTTHEAILREAGYEKKSEGKYQKIGGFGFILQYFETDAEERKHIMSLHPDERKEFTFISTIDIYMNNLRSFVCIRVCDFLRICEQPKTITRA